MRFMCESVVNSTDDSIYQPILFTVDSFSTNIQSEVTYINQQDGTR